MIPIAIPNDQNAPIAESSRTPCRDENHWMPKAERIEKIRADRKGLIPA